MRSLVGNSYGRMRTAGHAAPRVPPSVGAGATCGRGGESHAASGQIALLAQLGQLSRPVNNTSQSRQHQASASRIGPWHHGVPDSLDSGMAHPPRTPPPPASGAGGSGPDSRCCLRAGYGAGAGSGGRGDCAGGPSCGMVDHSAGRWWGRQRTHGEPVVGPWAYPYAGANAMNTKIDKFCYKYTTLRAIQDAREFVGRVREGDARMSLPTQKTCSTAGPLCIIHSPKRDLLGRGSFVSACPYHSAYAKSCVRPMLGYPYRGCIARRAWSAWGWRPAEQGSAR
jgi:hypothetical protein